MTPISTQDPTEVFNKWGKIADPCGSVALNRLISL
jgi:hypothetical protein